ncbi:MAG: SDR family NAD(P)-dependent oxidoreductase [Heteroscytonema crispum UTEX LB 1556]
MMIKSNKKTALVTGGGKGIGRAISLKLGSLGYNVAVNYLSDSHSAEVTVEDIKTMSGTAMLVCADVSNSQEVGLIVKQVDAAYGGVDVLVNNAGINIDKPFLDMTDEEWDRVVDINLKGAFLVSREVSRLMKAKQLQGNIINIAATTGIAGRKNGVNYCASKAGLLVMTRCLAKELAPDIRVNSVIPGFTRTAETIERFQLDTQEEYELSKRQIPLNRLGKPQEVAALVAFILSEEGAYINGQKFIVDGGEYMV